MMTNDERIEHGNGIFQGKVEHKRKVIKAIDGAIIFGIDNMSQSKSTQEKGYWQGYADALGELKEGLYDE